MRVHEVSMGKPHCVPGNGSLFRERLLVCAITVAERQMSFMFVITLHIKATAAINEAFVTSVAALHAPVMHIIRGKCNVGNH